LYRYCFKDILLCSGENIEENGMEERIIKALKANPQGLMIKEIAERVGMSRVNITKYIYVLIERGLITERKAGGRAKILYLAENWKKKSKGLMTLTFFSIMLMLSLPLALAQTQSHPLSEISPMDVNLNLTGRNITNVSYVFFGNNSVDTYLYRSASGILSLVNSLLVSNWVNATNINASGTIYGTFSGSLTGAASDLACTNCVALGTETTGNYVAGLTNGTGIIVTGTAGEGWSPTVAINTSAVPRKDQTETITGAWTMNSLTLGGNMAAGGYSITGAAWLNATSLNASGNVYGSQLCIGADCKTAWAQVGAGNTSAEIIAAVNNTGYYQFQAKNATDLQCTDCIGSTEIAGLTQGDLASTFSINWGNLTGYNLNVGWSGGLGAGNITSGTLANARLDATVYTVNGSGLSASNITSGVFDTARIPNLDASKITSGTLSNARLDGNLAWLNNSQTWSTAQTFNEDVTINKNLRVAGNITYVNSQTINVNGSINPPIDNLFDVGNSTNRWRSGVFASWVNGTNLNATTAIYGQTIYEAGTALSSKYVSRTDWTTHDNYPSGCSAGYAVQVIGDTLACVQINATGGVGDITAVYAGTGLTGGGSSGDVTLNLNSSYETGTIYDARFVNEAQANSITSAMITDGTITASDLTSNLGLGWGNLTGYPSVTGSGGLAGGGDLSTSRVITLSPTLSINWGNISTYNLNTAWTGKLGWVNLTAYPNACGAGQYVSQVGDTLTCSVPTGTGNTSAEVIAAVNNTGYYQFQAKNATDLQCTDCIGSTEIAGLTQGDLASTFSINWGNLTGYNLNVGWSGGLGAGNITSGTLSNARLDSKVYLVNSTEGLSASNITSGTLSNARLDTRLYWINSTGLDASNITSGTINNLRLDSNIAWQNATETISGAWTINSLTLGGNMNANSNSITSANWVNATNVNASNQICVGGICRTSWPGGLSGSGTEGYVPTWKDSTTLNNSVIFVNGSNVGIGTTSPTQKLDVVGYILSDVSSNEGGLYLGNTNHGLRRLSGTNNVELFTASGNVYLSANGAGSNQVTLLNSGNVGIGTTTPQNKLDVEGGVAVGATYSGTNTAPTNGMIVEGNVLIGTTTDNQKLTVSGNIAATGSIGAGCEGWCESSGGYSLMYDTGVIQSSASVKTPIFYDLNNEAYYLDPASASILSKLTVDNVTLGTGAATINKSVTNKIVGNRFFYAGDETEVTTTSITYVEKKRMLGLFDDTYGLKPRYVNVMARLLNTGGPTYTTTMNVTFNTTSASLCAQGQISTTSSSYTPVQGSIDVSGCPNGAVSIRVYLKTDNAAGTAKNDLIELWFVE